MIVLAAQRILVQDPNLLASGLLGSDDTWDKGWVFPEKPGATIENSQKCAIVITLGSPWTDPNPHNRAEFATLVVDIWADPTRRADKSVRFDDAQDKIVRLTKIVDQSFHIVNNSVPADAPAYLGERRMPRIWGTAQQVLDRTGITIVESSRGSGPEMAPMANNPGGYRGRLTYNVQYSSPA